MSSLKLEARALHEDGWLDRSPAAFVVHIYALSYCNEQATDGLISSARAARLVCSVPPPKIPAAWAELVAAGLWREVDGGYVCDTFTTYGLSADEQNATRQKWNDDKRRQRLHRNGNHDLCTPRACPVARGQVESSTSGQVESSTSDKWTTRPDPTRPDPTLRGGEEEGAADASSSARATDETPPVAEKHHPAPGCCALSAYLRNRHHWQPLECPGCNDPAHGRDVFITRDVTRHHDVSGDAA